MIKRKRSFILSTETELAKSHQHSTRGKNSMSVKVMCFTDPVNHWLTSWQFRLILNSFNIEWLQKNRNQRPIVFFCIKSWLMLTHVGFILYYDFYLTEQLSKFFLLACHWHIWLLVHCVGAESNKANYHVSNGNRATISSQDKIS